MGSSRFHGGSTRFASQIVVLLRSGYTKLGEVASVLGYKNHSPVSKYLARIRRKAEEHFFA